MSIRTGPPPAGPPPGAGGPMAVRVKVNCFEITTLPTKEYIQYDVSFSPECQIPRKRQELVARLQNDVRPDIFSPRGIYDGKALMYVSRVFDFGQNQDNAAIFLVADQPNIVPNPNARGVYQIKLVRTRGDPIRPSILSRLMSGQATPDTAIAVNLLQLLIRQRSDQKYPHNARAYFSNADVRSAPGGIELWRGFFQSVRPTVGRMLVNIDTTIAAMYQSGPLTEVALAIIGSRNVRDLQLEPSMPNYRKLENFLKNVRIVTRTTGDRTKTIRGLVSRAGDYEFTNDKEGGRTTTVTEYYMHTYNLRLQYPKIFGVLLTPKNAAKRVVVPLEFCKVKPGQIYRKKLPDAVTAEAVRFSVMKPEDRLGKISGASLGPGFEHPIVGYSQSEYVIDSQMVVNPQPITILGTLLPPPALGFGSGQIGPRDGSWNVKGQRFWRPSSMPYWAVLNFCPSVTNRVSNVVSNLRARCTGLGMAVQNPIAIVNGTGQNPDMGLADLLHQLAEQVPQRDAQGRSTRPLVLVLLPSRAAEIRTRVKHWGDCETGIITQCLKEDKFSDGNDQYYNNVALKINARLSGSNFTANSANWQKFKSQPFMIMGADVGHPGPGVMRPSIASLVYSHDPEGTKYAALSCVQPPREERIAQLGGMVGHAVNSFASMNKQPPKSILFYRDGLSEGEFVTVGGWEIGEIQAAIDKLWQAKGQPPNTRPKITYIIVGKRHHICFFPDSPNTRDKNGNVVAGFTTNDGQLQNPFVRANFYLQSHAAIKGTSRSSHYTVLRDDNFGFNAAPLKELSYIMCHIYAKATRSVSIPAPVYYADLVCSRAAFHFNPNSGLNYADSDTASSAGGGQPEFDISPWQQGYMPIKGALANEMYFL